MANRLALDTQGRLVLRESGKIVLPYEHFANAVMLKHMTGPHGLHLSVEATVRAVIESYTIGRENFGMEKEFIIEVVQSCPNPACRYYKNHLGVGPPFMDPAFQAAAAAQMNSDYIQHLPQQMAAAAAAASTAEMVQVDLTTKQVGQSISSQGQRQAEKHAKAIATQQHQQAQAQAHQQQQQQAQAQAQQQQQQQITAAIIQQQNRAIAQQNLEKFGNLSAIEKQRVLQQLDKKHFEVAAAHVAANLASATTTPITPQSISISLFFNIIISHVLNIITFFSYRFKPSVRHTRSKSGTSIISKSDECSPTTTAISTSWSVSTIANDATFITGTFIIIIIIIVVTEFSTQFVGRSTTD